MSVIKLSVVYFCICLLVLFSCFSDKPKKFYYSPRNSYYFKINDSDKFQQNFTFTASKIMYDAKPDTFGISFLWMSRISDLRQVDSIHIYLVDSMNNEMQLPFYSAVVYEDIPNAPYKIKYVPLQFESSQPFGCAFENTPAELDSAKRVNLFAKMNIPFKSFPEKLKMKLEVFAKSKKMNFETEFGKARNISDGPSNRPFG